MQRARQREVPNINPSFLACATRLIMVPFTEIMSGVGQRYPKLSLKGLDCLKCQITLLVKLLIRICKSLERFGTEIEMHLSLVVALSCDLYEQIVSGNKLFDISWSSLSNEFNKSQIALHNYS